MRPMRSVRGRRSTHLRVARPRITSTCLHVMGIAVVMVTLGMVVGGIVEWTTTNRDTHALFGAAAITFAVGALLWWITEPGGVRSRDVFAAVGWTWVSVTVLGALPYLFGGTFAVEGIDRSGQLVNALFESASGYTATGSTALTDFSVPGRGMLMYRQVTQWYGGMGVVVLTVTILPFLGVGGLDLMRAEAPGPISERLHPRVSETAKRLWATYVLLTVAVMAALVVVPGPSVYDGIAHGLTSISTGGFSPHAESIGHFDSVVVELVIMVAMVAGGVNFALHWRALTGGSGRYSDDPEFRAFMVMLAGGIAVVSAILWLDGGFALPTALRVGAFNVIALGTSSGFGVAQGAGSDGDYVTWLPSAQMILLSLMVVGACAGSTSGGIKVMRVQVLLAHSIRSVRRMQHPNAVIPVKHGPVAVREDLVSRMAGFFVVYALLVLTGMITLTVLSGDLTLSLGAVVSALGNMGTALEAAGPTGNFTDAFSEPARLVLVVYILIGRLEIFPILLMFAAPLRVIRDR